MEQLVSTIGVPAIVVILILREVIPAFRKNGDGKDNGKGDHVGRLEFDDHKKSVRYADTCDKVHEGIQRQFNSMQNSLDRIERYIKNGNKE